MFRQVRNEQIGKMANKQIGISKIDKKKKNEKNTKKNEINHKHLAI